MIDRHQYEKILRQQEGHQPDCSSISDQLLREVITYRWPPIKGVSYIPYSFSDQPLLMDAYGYDPLMQRYKQGSTDERFLALIRPIIETILDRWSTLSKGLLRFFEEPRLGIFARGIFFYFADSHLFLSDGVGGFTVRRYDNDQNIMRSYVFLPNNATSLQDIKGLRMINHELGHALGFEHLHDMISIQGLLNQTWDGVYCSVMPYLSFISTKISRCLMNCDPPYAIGPGPLDFRLLKLAYAEGLMTTAQVNADFLVEDIVYNIKELSTFSFSSTLFYHTVFLTISCLLDSNGKSLSSKHAARVISDLIMITTMVSLNFPQWVLKYFLMAALLKYLPTWLPLPKKLEAILSDDLSLYIFNLSCCYSYGQETYPLARAGLSSLTATFFGSRVTSILEKGAKLLIQSESDQEVCSAESEESGLEQKLNQTPLPSMKSTRQEDKKAERSYLDIEKNSFFNKKPSTRNSLCTRLFSWFIKSAGSKNEDTKKLVVSREQFRKSDNFQSRYSR